LQRRDLLFEKAMPRNKVREELHRAIFMRAKKVVINALFPDGKIELNLSARVANAIVSTGLWRKRVESNPKL